MGCSAKADSHDGSRGSRRLVLGTARGRIEAGGCCRGVFGGAKEVGLVMILVGILVALGSKLMPVATLESLELSLTDFVQEGLSQW
mmetsp:Transcript_5878/g.12384  ORF Transcript_5878/g.12384 Transcript_5878/m.12384 type:complete len:86 (-) Transcript_5878:277-534(-)